MAFADRVKSAQPADNRKPYFIRDNGERGSVQGLSCKVYPNGRKSWMFEYRPRTRRIYRRVKIGEYPQEQVPEARRRAGILAQRRAMGEDPKGDWDDQKRERTVDDLFEHTFAHYWSKSGKTPAYLANIRWAWTTRMKQHLGALKLSEVTPPLLKRFHRSVVTSDGKPAPCQANRFMAFLSKMFAFAEEEGWRDPGTNPCRSVSRNPTPKRERYATPAELAAIGEILERDREKKPREVAFIECMMYTGARPESLAAAKYADLKRETLNGEVVGVLSFAGKMSRQDGEFDTIIFAPEALAIVDRLPPSPRGRLLCPKPEDYWDQVRNEIGAPDLWLRDLRRTMATIALSNGERLELVSKLLNHRSMNTTNRVYAMMIREQKAAGSMRIAKHVAGHLAAREKPPEPCDSEGLVDVDGTTPDPG